MRFLLDARYRLRCVFVDEIRGYDGNACHDVFHANPDHGVGRITFVFESEVQESTAPESRLHRNGSWTDWSISMSCDWAVESYSRNSSYCRKMHDSGIDGNDQVRGL